MSLTVRYFAAAAHVAGRDQDTFSDGEIHSLDDLRGELENRYGPEMATVLRSGSFLVGGTVRRDGHAILAADSEQPGDTVVDVLPPFAGG